MADTIRIDTQDVIDVLKSQRNAALDEIVQQAAIIRSLRRELAERPIPEQPKDAI